METNKSSLSAPLTNENTESKAVRTYVFALGGLNEVGKRI